MTCAGHVARVEEARNVYKIVAGKAQGNRPAGRPKRRWEDNIKIDFKEMKCEDRDQWRALENNALGPIKGG
jgi:glutamate dehydrogenase/leucine dehydrogenase